MVCTNGMFDFYEVASIGLYFAVIGYKFLMFGYFLIIRYRKSKRIYWLYFSLFFIFLAVSRVGYLFYDYFIDPADTFNRLLAWRFANITGWVAVASLSGILSTLLFTGESKLHMAIKKIFPLIPLGIAVHIIFIPDSWIYSPSALLTWGIAKWYMNVGIMPIYIFLLPIMFFYLAKKSAGTLQRSFFINGLGLFLYYAVRAVQAITPSLWWPLLILLAILLMAFANQYEHLK
nr:hypothetical protein [Candidatus Sigynarchaeota archaeon]